MPLSRKSLFIISFCFSSAAIAAAEPQTLVPYVECPIPQPEPIVLTNPELLDDQAIAIESKNSYVEKNQSARFSGEVKLAVGDKKISADEILIDRENGQIKASGHTRFQNNSLTVEADSLEGSSVENKVVLTNSNYQLNGAPGKGSADILAISEQGVMLKNANFTTCTDVVPDWQIFASEINLDHEEDIGEAWNSVFRVKDVPVFYLPYFSFPLSDQRKTGFLYPQISTSSKSGFKLGLPFYLNISENMDATITPYHMSKRGTQLKTEFRHLTGQLNTQINFDYLDSDDELTNNDDARYLTRLQHAGTFRENYRVHVDYGDISDDNYLVDIGSDQFSKNDAYLLQVGELSYFSTNWHSSVKVQDFKVLGQNSESYSTLPQLEAELYQPLGFLNSTLNVYSEYSHFDISDPDQPTADRLHLEAGLNIPFSKPGWFVNSDLRIMHTIYQQDNIDQISQALNLNLEKEVKRTLPKVRIHAGLNFDRPTTLFFEEKIQTLEPQIQYLYIPQKNQDEIYIYDTSPLQDDFDGLFRDKRFSGLDRIAQANQISVGATTRILNSDNTELFRLSLGRIFYSDETSLSFNEDGEDENASAVAGDLFVQLAKRWQLQTDIQYDTKQNATERSQVSIDYRKDSRNVFQLNHRYIRNISDVGIEQASVLASFPINQDWQFVGRVTHDLIRKRSLEAYAGLQYESCCWAVRFAVHRSINTNLDDSELNQGVLHALAQDTRDEFDNGFILQFVLKGLGGKQKPLGVDDMLESGIFGYKRPYFLSN